MTSLELAGLSSPLGPLALAVGPRGLVTLDLEGDEEGMLRRLERRFGALSLARAGNPGGVVEALRRYFDGGLEALDELPVDPGGTPFQHQVWLTLRRIRAGETWSYARLAAEVGRSGHAHGCRPERGRRDASATASEPKASAGARKVTCLELELHLTLRTARL